MSRIVIAALSAAMVVASVAVATDRDDTYDWTRLPAVEVDLDRNGHADVAELGVAAKSVRLRLTVNSKRLPLVDIPVDGSKEFGICPGSPPSLRVIPQSEAPLNALGETPRGYRICEECVEILVMGGECDALHFYWDATTGQLAWWRA